MRAVVAVLAGVAASAVLILFARTTGSNGALRIYALGLLVTALLYVVLAGMAGASIGWLVLESIGVLIYGGAAWTGVRGSSKVLAFGWAAHVLWDVLLHLNGPAALYTPDWYPWFCVSFDLIVAVAVLRVDRS